MSPITISLSDDDHSQLKTLAEQAGVSPEVYLQQQVEQFLKQQDADFAKAAEHVLSKNAELYKRLS